MTWTTMPPNRSTASMLSRSDRLRRASSDRVSTYTPYQDACSFRARSEATRITLVAGELGLMQAITRSADVSQALIGEPMNRR